MKKYIIVSCLMLGLFLGVSFSFSFQFGSNTEETRLKATQIIKKNCSVVGCHAGPFPAMNLNLEEEKFENSLLGKLSQELDEFKLIDVNNPEKSYLLKKIRGEEGIVGKQMPADSRPLLKQDQKVIEDWIRSLKDSMNLESSGFSQSDSNPKFNKPAFWGTRLVNLPTTQSLGKGQIQFRISHKFFPAIKNGLDEFFGLDGPAAMLLGLGYGITDNLSVMLSRSNRFKDVELALKWVFARQGGPSSFPFFAAFNLSGSTITQAQAGDIEKSKANIQLLLSRQISTRFSLLLVPSYSSNANHWDESPEGTFSVGTGMRYMVFDDFSVIVEWIPVLSGYKANSSGWGIGIEKKIGGHVFQVFLLNTIGITSSQYLPGGDFKLRDTEFRLGFNIFRLF